MLGIEPGSSERAATGKVLRHLVGLNGDTALTEAKDRVRVGAVQGLLMLP